MGGNSLSGLLGTRRAKVALLLGVLLASLATALAGPAQAAPFSAKINFQPEQLNGTNPVLTGGTPVPVPAGYTKDVGLGYDDARGYGWVRQDSLSASTHVPLSVVPNSRDRNSVNKDQRLDTLIHMQAPASSTTMEKTPAAWEYALPNGAYLVTVAVGDPTNGADAESHTVNVEGVEAIKGFPKSAATNGSDLRHRTATVRAMVSDGRLTVDAQGGTNTKINYVDIVEAPTTSSADLRVNFQNDTAPLPPGYLRDFGEAYGARGAGSGASGTTGLEYGWVTPGTSTPLNLVGNGRDRNESNAATPLDQRLDTLLHMQGNNVPNFNGVAQPGSWEVAVPDGKYAVEVSVGDPTPGNDVTTHRINVESTSVIADHSVSSTTTGAARFAAGTGSVDVTDGRLTVDAQGGTNTKINYVDLARVGDVTPPVDTTPPGAPNGLTATPGDGHVDLEWDANTESDLGGYNVYRGTSASVDTSGTPLNATLLGQPGYSDSAVQNGTEYHYVVEAVDQSGNKSNASARVSATPRASTAQQFNAKINFQSAAAAVPTGYFRDYGQPYGARTDANQGSGLSFGWVNPTTRQPLDLSVGGTTPGNGRDRNDATVADQRLDTLMHMQADDVSGTFNGTAQEGAWEIAVPNGTYEVILSVGDPTAGADPMSHEVNVEGVKAIDNFVPNYSSSPQIRFKPATVTAAVSDGRLTIDATGGTNTKINYADIASIQTGPDTTPPSAPASILARVGDGEVSVTWSANTEGDLDGYNVYAGTSATGTPLNATLLGTTYLIDRGLTNGTQRSYVVEAVDRSGNKSAAQPVSATPQAGATDNRPRIVSTAPADGATNVALSGGVAATLNLITDGVDDGTFSSDTIKLTKVSNGAQVPASYGTSGGNDVINLIPNEELEPNTQYRFEVTEGVRDLNGTRFLPYSSTFTTGTTSVFTPPGVTTGDVGNAAFDRVAQPSVPNKTYTSVTMGPDNKLYAGTITGEIYRFDVAADGNLSNAQTINTIRQNTNDCNTSTVGNNGCTTNRLIIGLTFEPGSTAQNPRLWVTHSYYGFNNMKDWGGKLSVLSGSNLDTYRDVVVNLPRSSKDHLTNSIAFHNGKIYIPVGATTAMGAYDNAWKGTERLLSAAVIEVDYQNIQGTLDVRTADGGTYDPYAASALVKVFASGVRNAVDLVWHSNGSLYTPTNGSAGGSNAPATPTDFQNRPECQNRSDGPYTGPSIPDFDGPTTGGNGGMQINKTQDDYLFRVVRGGYYGNPNPSRCEWVLNGGNPTAGADPGENPAYPVGTSPDRNWRGWAYDFKNNQSPNGAIEYRSNNFGGKLKGKLLVARYSQGDDIIVLEPGANGSIARQNVGVPGLNKVSGSEDPLDLIEDTRNGNLYVTEGVRNPPDGTGKITLLRARDTGEPNPANVSVDKSRLVFNDVQNAGPSQSQNVTVTNDGASDLTISGASLSGANADQFQISAGPSGSVTLTPGQTQQISVLFNPTSAGVKGASLDVASNDADTPVAKVMLRGLGTRGEGGQNEPSLQWILDTYEIPIDVGDPDPLDNAMPTAAQLGDEVEAESFERAYAGSDVTVEPLAVFGPRDTASGTVTRVGNYASGQAAGKQQIFTVPNAGFQSLNPTAEVRHDFAPAADSFGFYSVWPFFGDREVFGEDALNTWEANTANRHKVRVYPMKNKDGSTEPNAYVVATEETTSGFDYQDVVFVVRNVEPASPGGEPGVTSKINFQPNGSAVPAGYTKDIGEGYAASRGFGWVVPGTSTPVDKTADTRERGTPASGPQKTLILMQNDTVASAKPGSWEYAVPNGTYDVTVSVGDGEFTDSTHRVLVESTVAIDNFAPTTASPFRTATATIDVADGRLTVAATGGTNTKLNYVEIADGGPTVPDDTDPTVDIELGGTQEPGGAFKNTASVTINAADQGGSGVRATTYSLDGGPFQAYAGPFDVGGTGTHTVTARAVDRAGNSAETTETFSVVSSQAELELENLDGVPFPDRLAFNTIPVSGRNGTIPNGVHDEAKLRIKNTGADPLGISSISIAGPWQLVNGPTLPATVGVGGQLDLTVRFVATGGNVHNGTLTIRSDDADEPTTVVQLGGFWQSVSEGGQEPSLVETLQAYGYRTTILGPGQQIDNGGELSTIGEEILVPYWQRADTARPVAVHQLSAFHVQGDVATLSTTDRATSANSPVNPPEHQRRLTHYGVDAQSFLPRQEQDDHAPGNVEFTPTQRSFGFRIAGVHGDWTMNEGSVQCHEARESDPTIICGHHFRTWPARDRAGEIMPNTYIMTMDYPNGNGDYNDNVYLVTNIKPAASVAGPPAAPTGLSATGSTGGIALDWADNADEDLAGYNVYRGEGTSGPFTKLNTGLIVESNFSDVQAQPDGRSYYRVTAVDGDGNESDPATADAIRPPADTTPPTVADRSPLSGATNVARVANVTITFSEAMDPSTVSAPNSFRLTKRSDGARVAASVTYDAATKTATVDPTALLEANTAYKVTIGNTGVKDAAGNTLAASVAWNFTTGTATDNTPPVAPTGLSATGSAGGIALDWADSTEGDLAGYNVYRAQGVGGPFTKLNATALSGSQYNDAAAPVGAVSHYRVTAVDASGNESGPATAQTERPGETDTTAPTVIERNPSAGAVRVPPSTTVRATFSEDMNASTIGPAMRLVRIPDNVRVAAQVSYDPPTRTVTLIPNATLEENTTYRVNISTLAKDAAGNAIAAPVVWTFTTLQADNTPPAAPTINLAAASDSGSSNTDRLTNDATPTFTGTAEAGSEVSVFDAGSLLGSVSANAAGEWSFAPSQALSGGAHTLTARAEDSAGNGSDPSGAIEITVDTMASSTQPPVEGFVLDSRLAAATVPVRIGWSASDENGIDSYQLQRSVDGGAFAGVALSPASTTDITQSLAPGASYVYRVRATDKAGNVGAWATGSAFRLTAHQESDPAITYGGTWTSQSLAGAYGGAVTYAAGANSEASFAFTGTRVAWIATSGPNRGLAEVWLDGVKVRTVDLYSASAGVRRVVFSESLPDPGEHELEVRVLGARNPASTGNRVEVDAFVVLR